MSPMPPTSASGPTALIVSPPIAGASSTSTIARRWIVVVVQMDSGISLAVPEGNPGLPIDAADGIVFDVVRSVHHQVGSHGICLYAIFLRRRIARGDLVRAILQSGNAWGLLGHEDVVGSILGAGGSLSAMFGYGALDAPRRRLSRAWA